MLFKDFYYLFPNVVGLDPAKFLRVQKSQVKYIKISSYIKKSISDLLNLPSIPYNVHSIVHTALSMHHCDICVFVPYFFSDVFVLVVVIKYI